MKNNDKLVVPPFIDCCAKMGRMTDYTKLVEDLHDIEKTMFALGTSPINMDNVSIKLAYDKEWGRTAKDAADAIEALNHLVDLNTERCEGLRKQLREAHENYEKHLNELEAQMPKLGEWIWKHRHHGGFKTAKGKCECGRDVYAQIDERYETDDPYCPFCGVMNDSIHLKYCPNCGAKMIGEQNVE